MPTNAATAQPPADAEPKPKQPKAKSKSDGHRKRGPPRPHRKLSDEILHGRIEKLQKRINRAKGQLEDAERHIEGYVKEEKYREKDAQQA